LGGNRDQGSINLISYNLAQFLSRETGSLVFTCGGDYSQRVVVCISINLRRLHRSAVQFGNHLHIGPLAAAAKPRSMSYWNTSAASRRQAGCNKSSDQT
jgi:hypothetical protein